MNDEQGLSKIVRGRQKEGSLEWLIRNAPTIALIAANVGVAFGEYRVFDIVRTLTGSTWKAVGAILSTGIPFMVWELLWQYRIASGFQRTLAIVGAVIAFVSAVVLGIQDYIVVVDASGAATNVNVTAILTWVVLLVSVHVVMWLVFFYTDPKVARERAHAEKQAEFAHEEESTKISQAILARASQLLASQQQLYGQYGKANVDELLSALAGAKSTALPVGEDNHKDAASLPTNGNGRNHD